MASIRSSPVGPAHFKHTRDARIRREIDLALLAAGKRGVAARRAATAPQEPQIIICSSPTKLPPITPRIQMDGPAMPFLRGMQVASTIAETGSYSSRGLQGSPCRYKNMESPLPFFY